jgi:hypothetical protein
MILLAVIFGFKNQDYSESNKSILFDACFDYINSNSKINGVGLKHDLLDLNEKNKNIQSNNSISSVPDSTLKPNKPAGTDSLVKKIKPAENDSLVKKIISTEDDSLLKKITPVNADSLKKKIKPADFDSARKKIKPTLPDSLVKKIKPAKADSLVKPIIDVKTGLTKKLLTSEDSLKIKVKQDSLKRLEIISRDSTARIKYFHFNRDDYPNVLFRPKRRSSFFVYPSEGMFSRPVQLDSTGKEVTIKENLAGKPIREYLVIPTDEFIKLNLDAVRHDVWEQKGHEYTLKIQRKIYHSC